jgi:hypothetical protein
MGVFEIPPNPFGRDGYFGRLAGAFGWKYVIVVMVTYGLNQGGLSYWGRQGRAFYFRDAAPKGVELSPAKGLIVENFGKLPWDLKAMFGVVSDAFAIRGLHRTPYILAGAIFGFVGWGLLGVLDQPDAGLITLLVVLGNISIAMPDVMIDATIAEKCGQKPSHAVDLQSLGWGSIYFTSILAPLAFGPMYTAFNGTKTIFLVCLIFPPILFTLVAMGWLGEEVDPDPSVKRAEFWDIMKNALTLGRYQGKFAETRIESFQENVQKDGVMTSTNPKVDEGHTFTDREEYIKFGKLYLLAMIISVIVFTAGTVLSEYGSEKTITIPVWLVCTGGICIALYKLMGPITYDLAYGAMYIFLRNALAPLGGNVMTYWNTDTSTNPNNYNQCGPFPINGTQDYGVNETEWGLDRPCLSETYVTSIDSLGGFMGLIGIALYARYLSHWSYKKIFMTTAVMGFCFNFLDFIWVTRASNAAGIPDEFMRLFGEEIVAEVLGNWDTLPMFVLAAKLCPKGLEATLFALLMGLSNFGRTMGSYMGSIIINELELSQKQGFDNLWLWILIRNFSYILVIALIPFLVPGGSPQDKSIYDDDESIADAEAVGITGRQSIENDVLVEGAKRNSYAASL